MAALMSGPADPTRSGTLAALGAYEVREARSPKGPTGLWAALTRDMDSSLDREQDLEIDAVDEDGVVDLSSAAHLRYLARLAPVDATQSAEVIDLAAARARRSA